MENRQEDQIVVILSPQNWSHQFVSKHHYAVEFSKICDTFFVSPTINKLGELSFSIKIINKDNPRLFIAQLVLPFPNWFRFKFIKLYRVVNRITLNFFLKKHLKHKVKLVIDFGCHKAIDRLDKFNSASSIYFPVDDYVDLPIDMRHADKLFTVSSKIQEKFERANIPITWINHGLSSVFEELAKAKLIELKRDVYLKSFVRKKIGYSGNLSIPFIDRDSVLNTILALPEFDFHFFGNYSGTDDAHEFIHKLKHCKNVMLHGQLTTEKLAEQLFQMDILWLCYKADGKNYHLENSHKILEYLATGLPIVSSPIKYLEDADKNLIYQFQNNQHLEVITDLKDKKEGLKEIIHRIEFSLESTYDKNISLLLS